MTDKAITQRELERLKIFLDSELGVLFNAGEFQQAGRVAVDLNRKFRSPNVNGMFSRFSYTHLNSYCFDYIEKICEESAREFVSHCPGLKYENWLTPRRVLK